MKGAFRLLMKICVVATMTVIFPAYGLIAVIFALLIGIVVRKATGLAIGDAITLAIGSILALAGFACGLWIAGNDDVRR